MFVVTLDSFDVDKSCGVFFLLSFKNNIQPIKWIDYRLEIEFALSTKGLEEHKIKQF